ncbi:TPA: hypothetical protein DCZ39_07675 [Patescibacteria group bacterium]|nr:hypothetical protein [Candidatus Gracilibacteria bacterium]
MHDIRLHLQGFLRSNYGLEEAFRENMPTAGIVYDVMKSHEELFKDMNESCRKRTKKSIAQGLEYRIVDQKDSELFFAKWQKTADTK